MASTGDTPTDKKAKASKPTPDGPPEVEDAARQEGEYPEDDTDEG